MGLNKRIVYVVNVDTFFKSHRLPLAIEAKKKGYEVFLLTKYTSLKAEFESLGIICYDIPINRGFTKLLYDFILLFKLIYYYFVLKPAIIHHITLKAYLYGTIAARISARKSKIINAVTGLGYLNTDVSKNTLKIILIFILRISLKTRLDIRYIFQNNDDLIYFKKISNININSTYLIKGSGVCEKTFYRQKRNSSDKIIITLVARLIKEKGVYEFLQAAKMLKLELKDKCEFLLVGGIDLQNPSYIEEKEINDLMEDGYISWLGERADIKKIYEETHIACLPSYREGIPKSLIEAMAMECPIITTDVPGCRDCVDEGINGFLVPIMNVERLAYYIKKLAFDCNLRYTMGKKSREKMIKEMSLNKIVDMTFDVYEF